jgi:hypothetical protein
MEKKVSARQFAVIPYACCTRPLSGVNIILNQEVRLYVFLLGQVNNSSAIGHGRSIALASPIMDEVACFQDLSGIVSAKMDPLNAGGK